MNKNFNKYLASISYFPKFGPVRLGLLMNYFKDSQRIFQANVSEIVLSGISEELALEFVEFRKSINPDKVWDFLQKNEIKIVVLGDSEYPELLSKIHTPPYLLFYRGQLPKNNDLNLAFVGSRKCTQYGEYAVSKIVSELVTLDADINIISGLALGIDSISHGVALKNNINTIAILGSGVDDTSIYPQSNRALAHKIIESNGAVMSEFPPGTGALRHHFPQRNRIVAGMSLATLVIEAEEKSGALITSKYALEENRDVFALPGQINSKSSVGTNNLIKYGAIPLLGASDIINLYDLSKKEVKAEEMNLNEMEAKICLCLSHEPLHVNQIVKTTGINISELSSNLTMMEIKGVVKNVGGMEYVRI